MGHCDRVLVGPLEPGQVADISVEMVSPAQSGDYQGVWRMSSASGHFFGGLLIFWLLLESGCPRILPLASPNVYNQLCNAGFIVSVRNHIITL